MSMDQITISPEDMACYLRRGREARAEMFAFVLRAGARASTRFLRQSAAALIRAWPICRKPGNVRPAPCWQALGESPARP